MQETQLPAHMGPSPPRAQIRKKRTWYDTVMKSETSGSRDDQLNRTSYPGTTLEEAALPQQQIQQHAEVNKIKNEPHGAEQDMHAEDKIAAEYRLNQGSEIDAAETIAADNRNKDLDLSDTETEYETNFKESPWAPAMIKDQIFGHWRRRNMADDDRKRPSIMWDEWRDKSREKRAKGRKPLGYKHGDIKYTYEEWIEAKMRRTPVNQGLLCVLDGLPR